MLLENFEQSFLLGVDEMDDTHREFVAVVNRLNGADKVEFVSLFAELVEHTQAHFEHDNELMPECGFRAISEHKAEHDRVLGDLHRFNARVAAGNVTMGRAYVRENLSGWFELHAQTMDSALAAALKVHRDGGCNKES